MELRRAGEPASHASGGWTDCGGVTSGGSVLRGSELRAEALRGSELRAEDSREAAADDMVPRVLAAGIDGMYPTRVMRLVLWS